LSAETTKGDLLEPLTNLFIKVRCTRREKPGCLQGNSNSYWEQAKLTKIELGLPLMMSSDEVC
jgi:hypothetical protein